MSAAAAADAAPAKGGKKLILFAIIGVLVLALAAVAAVMLLKKNPADDEEEDLDGRPAASQPAKKGSAAAPTFLPLDTFTVNLADRPAERYAQVGVTLEVESKEVAEQLKAYMPAIRSNVLMLLSQKTSTELHERAGKEQLAMEIMREAVRPLGIDLEEQNTDAAGNGRRPRARVHNPIVAVHFSNFIIQ